MNGLEVLMEGVAGFTTASVAQDDYTVLNKGVSKAMVLVHDGARVEHQGLAGTADVWHQVRIELFEQYKSPTNTINDLRDDAQLILTRSLQFPKLNAVANVLGFFVREVGPQEFPPQELIAQPNRWRMKTIMCEIWEHDTQAYQE